jgi:hypothetical protein
MAETDPVLVDVVSHTLPSTVKKIAPDPTISEDETSITTIGEEAFKNCINLKIIEMPKTVDTIEKRAFYNATNIESILIKRMQFIQPLAFGGLKYLYNARVPYDFSAVNFDTVQNTKAMSGVGLK